MPPKQIRIPDLLRASKPTSALGGVDVALTKLSGADLASRKLSTGSGVALGKGKRSRATTLEGNGSMIEDNPPTADVVGGYDVALSSGRKRARREIIPPFAADESLKSRPRGRGEGARKESASGKKRDGEVAPTTVSTRRRLSSDQGYTEGAVEGSSSTTGVSERGGPNAVAAVGRIGGTEAGDRSTSTSCSAVVQGGGVTPEQLRNALSRRLTTEDGELKIAERRAKEAVGEDVEERNVEQQILGSTLDAACNIGNTGRVEETRGRARMFFDMRGSGSVAESLSTSAPNSPRTSPCQIRTSPRRLLPPRPDAAPSSEAGRDRGRVGKHHQSSLDGWARVQKGPTPLRNYGTRGSLMAALVLGKSGPATPLMKSTPRRAAGESGTAKGREEVSEASGNLGFADAVDEDRVASSAAPGRKQNVSPRNGGILGWTRRVTRHGGGMTSPDRVPRGARVVAGEGNSSIPKKSAPPMRDAEPAQEAKLPPKYELLETLFDSVQTASKLVKARQHVCTYESIRRPVEELSNRRFLKSHLAQILQVYPEVIQLDFVRRQAAAGGLAGGGMLLTPSGAWELSIELLPPQMQSMAHTEGSADVDDVRSPEQMQSVQKGPDIGWMEQNRRRKEIFRMRLVNILNEHGEDYDIPQAPLPSVPPSSTNSTPSRSRPQTPTQWSYPCTPSICSPPRCVAEPTTTPRPLMQIPQVSSVTDNQSSCVKNSARRSMFKMGDLESPPRAARLLGFGDSTPISSLPFSSSQGGQESVLSSVSRLFPVQGALSPSSVRTRSQSLVETKVTSSEASTDLQPQWQKPYTQSQRRDLDARGPANTGYLASLAEAVPSANANTCDVGNGTGIMGRLRCRRGLGLAFATVAESKEAIAARGEVQSAGPCKEEESMQGKEETGFPQTATECPPTVEVRKLSVADEAMGSMKVIPDECLEEVGGRSTVEQSLFPVSQSGNESDDDRAAIIRSLPRALLQSVEDRSRQIAEDTSDLAIRWRKQRMAMSELPRLFDMVLTIYKSANRTVMSRDDLLNRICNCHCKLTSKDEIDLQLEYLLDHAPDWISSKTAMTGEVLYRIQTGVNTATIRRRLLSST